MIMTFRQELHGIPRDTLCQYLVQLGGEVDASGEVEGKGWKAKITSQPDYRIGKASFCSFLVEMEGDEDVLPTVWQGFEIRCMRPGG